MLTLVLWTSCLLSAQAETLKPDDLATQVRQLVRQLNSDELTKRDAAEQALIKLGVPALAALPQVTETTTPEVVQRLGRVRQALQMAAAEAAGQPSLVTLTAKQMPLAEVLKAMTQQTGNKIVDHRKAFGEEVTEPKLDLEFAKTPFWEALDKVLDEAQLQLYNYAGEAGIFVVNRPPGQLSRAEGAAAPALSGPFRIEGTRFEAVRDLRNPQNRSLKLFIDVAWEPRLHPVAIIQPLDAIKALGSDDEEIKVDGAEGEPEATVGEEAAAVELQIPLTLPERKVEKIASLSGKINAIVPGEAQTFRFEQLPIALKGEPKKVEQRKAGVTVTVDQVRKNNDIWELRMRVKFDDASQALESHRTWIFSNEAFLVGRDKKRINSGGYEQTRHTKDEVGIMYLFELPKGIEGLAFVYKTPVTILEVPVEYEIKDLVLP